MFLPGSLDERDLVDLLQRRDAGPDFVERGFTQESHSFFMRRLADFRRRPLFQNQFADAIGKIKQFVDGGAAMITRAAALDAPLSFVKIDLSPFLRIQTVVVQ